MDCFFPSSQLCSVCGAQWLGTKVGVVMSLLRNGSRPGRKRCEKHFERRASLVGVARRYDKAGHARTYTLRDMAARPTACAVRTILLSQPLFRAGKEIYCPKKSHPRRRRQPDCGACSASLKGDSIRSTSRSTAFSIGFVKCRTAGLRFSG